MSGKIKRYSGIIFCCLLGLIGCSHGNSDNAREDIVEEPFNKSDIAKAFADEVFEEYLEQFGQEYEIMNVSYGFNLTDETSYFIEYEYQMDNSDVLNYKYIILVNKDGTCSIVEEGNTND